MAKKCHKAANIEKKKGKIGFRLRRKTWITFHDKWEKLICSEILQLLADCSNWRDRIKSVGRSNHSERKSLSLNNYDRPFLTMIDSFPDPELFETRKQIQVHSIKTVFLAVTSLLEAKFNMGDRALGDT